MFIRGRNVRNVERVPLYLSSTSVRQVGKRVSTERDSDKEILFRRGYISQISGI